MPRLSIVIPSATIDSLAEDTLVSVLQHRPEYSEVLVVSSGPYADPYGLGREVRFLSVGTSDRLALLAAACQEARGDVIHVLLPGTLATDGWTDGIWDHFADERVGSVAPLILDGNQATRVRAAGVTYHARGERRLIAAGVDVSRLRQESGAVIAPVLDAGFYRRETLAALGGFDASVGEWLADVDFGIAARDLGFRAVVDFESRVLSTQEWRSGPRSYEEGRQAERLYRRHRDSASSGPWQHRISCGWEMLRRFPHPRALGCLLGRWSARRETAPRQAYEERLAAARQRLEAAKNEAHEVTTLSLDAHKRSRTLRMNARRAA